MEIKKKRAEDKKEFQNKLKQIRKQKSGGDALFDDDKGTGGKKAAVNRKREYKNMKFGQKPGQKAAYAKAKARGDFKKSKQGGPSRGGGKPGGSKIPGKKEPITETKSSTW